MSSINSSSASDEISPDFSKHEIERSEENNFGYEDFEILEILSNMVSKIDSEATDLLLTLNEVEIEDESRDSTRNNSGKGSPGITVGNGRDNETYDPKIPEILRSLRRSSGRSEQVKLNREQKESAKALIRENTQEKINKARELAAAKLAEKREAEKARLEVIRMDSLRIMGLADKQGFNEVLRDTNLKMSINDARKDAIGFKTNERFNSALTTAFGSNDPSIIQSNKIPFAMPYDSDKSLYFKLSYDFLHFCGMTGGIQDILDPLDRFNIPQVKTPAGPLDAGSEVNHGKDIKRQLNEWASRTSSYQLSGASSKYEIDLKLIGATNNESKLTVTLDEDLLKYKFSFLPEDIIFNTLTGTIKPSTYRYLFNGNNVKKNHFTNDGSSPAVDQIIIVTKVLGDLLKAYFCWLASWFVLTVDYILGERCNQNDRNVVVRKLAAGRTPAHYVFFPNNLPRRTGVDITNVVSEHARLRWHTLVGGNRVTRSKNKHHPKNPKNKKYTQRGGVEPPSVLEIIHGAYLHVLKKIISSYSEELSKVLTASILSEEDKIRVQNVHDFLTSKEFSAYLEARVLNQETDAFLKELTSWMPSSIIYNPEDMKTIYDIGEITGAPMIHNIHKVFPLQDDDININGYRFNNIFTPDYTFEVVKTNTSPKFEKILKRFKEVYNDSRVDEIISSGGVNDKTNQLFIEMLDHGDISYKDAKLPESIKEIFKEIIPDPREADQVYNLFVANITFHGYYILNHETIQKFVAILNANSGEFPGGFDAMKELVEDREVKDVKSFRNSAATYEVEVEEEEDPEIQRYKEQLAAGSHLTPMITVGGRRTRRRKANKVKVKGSRRNRLTKKERNW